MQRSLVIKIELDEALAATCLHDDTPGFNVINYVIAWVAQPTNDTE